jgi:hypothetical protein
VGVDHLRRRGFMGSGRRRAGERLVAESCPRTQTELAERFLATLPFASCSSYNSSSSPFRWENNTSVAQGPEYSNPIDSTFLSRSPSSSFPPSPASLPVTPHFLAFPELDERKTRQQQQQQQKPGMDDTKPTTDNRTRDVSGGVCFFSSN